MGGGTRRRRPRTRTLGLVGLGLLLGGTVLGQGQIERGWSTVTAALRFGAATVAGVQLQLVTNELALRNGADSGDAALRVGPVWSTSTIRGTLEGQAVQFTTSYTVLATDTIVASGSYSGPLTVTLPSATGRQGKLLIIHDQAGLADGTSNRTITISGVVNAGNSTTITTAFGMARLVGGVSAGSSAQWFVW